MNSKMKRFLAVGAFLMALLPGLAAAQYDPDVDGGWDIGTNVQRSPSNGNEVHPYVTVNGLQVDVRDRLRAVGATDNRVVPAAAAAVAAPDRASSMAEAFVISSLTK